MRGILDPDYPDDIVFVQRPRSRAPDLTLSDNLAVVATTILVIEVVPMVGCSKEMAILSLGCETKANCPPRKTAAQPGSETVRVLQVRRHSVLPATRKFSAYGGKCTAYPHARTKRTHTCGLVSGNATSRSLLGSRCTTSVQAQALGPPVPPYRRCDAHDRPFRVQPQRTSRSTNLSLSRRLAVHA